MAKTEGRTYANYVCALAPLALPGVMNIRTTKQPISKNYRGDFPPQRKNDKPLGWPVFDRRRRLPCWSGNHRRRTGEIHDYRRKAGVESAELFLPDGAPEWATDRAKLWNAAEQSEKRKNSTVAREFEVALPSELSADQRRKLAHDFAREVVKRHGFAVDVAIHAPGKEGDTRNHHAHILCTTRKLTAEGFTEKDPRAGRPGHRCPGGHPLAGAVGRVDQCRP